jgi:hypothetical protein
VIDKGEGFACDPRGPLELKLTGYPGCHLCRHASISALPSLTVQRHEATRVPAAHLSQERCACSVTDQKPLLVVYGLFSYDPANEL